MNYNPDRHHRRSIRLRGYDYSQSGAYFITICAQDRRHVFGKIEQGKMILNEFGQIAHREWEMLPERWPHLEMGAFQIMPNHMHGIIVIHDMPVGATLAVALLLPPAPGTTLTVVGPDADADATDADRGAWEGAREGRPYRDTQIQWATKPTIGQITGAYKSRVLTECLKWINAHQPAMQLGKLWQRNLWENIIRNEAAFDRITDYIMNNPSNWKSDKFFGAE